MGIWLDRAIRSWSLVFTEISVIRNSRVETESVFTEIEILEKKKNAHKLSRISDMNPPLPPPQKKRKKKCMLTREELMVRAAHGGGLRHWHDRTGS